MNDFMIVGVLVGFFWFEQKVMLICWIWVVGDKEFVECGVLIFFKVFLVYESFYNVVFGVFEGCKEFGVIGSLI